MSQNLTSYFDALVRHETVLWNAVDRRLRGGGIVTLGRLLVLQAIESADGGARMQAIADAVGTTIGAASRLVDRLRSDGLVDRASDTEDRRSVRVTLTEDGTAALAATRSAFDQALTELLAGVDGAVIAQATAAIETIDGALANGR